MSLEGRVLQIDLVTSHTSLNRLGQSPGQMLLAVEELLNTVRSIYFHRSEKFFFIQSHQNVIQFEECLLREVIDLDLAALN